MGIQYWSSWYQTGCVQPILCVWSPVVYPNPATPHTILLCECVLHLSDIQVSTAQLSCHSDLYHRGEYTATFSPWCPCVSWEMANSCPGSQIRTHETNSILNPARKLVRKIKVWKIVPTWVGSISIWKIFPKSPVNTDVLIFSSRDNWHISWFGNKLHFTIVNP